MTLAATAGRFHVDDDVFLPRVERPADAHDVGAQAGGAQLFDAQQLVATQLVALGFHFDEARASIVEHQQVRVTVARSLEIPAEAREHLPQRFSALLLQQREQRIDDAAAPAEHAVGRAVMRRARTKQFADHRFRLVEQGQLAVDGGAIVVVEGARGQVARQEFERRMQVRFVAGKQFVPEIEPEEGSPERVLDTERALARPLEIVGGGAFG